MDCKMTNSMPIEKFKTRVDWVKEQFDILMLKERYRQIKLGEEKDGK